MTQAFNCIGLIGKPNHAGAQKTLTALYNYLQLKSIKVVVDSRVARQLDIENVHTLTLTELGHQCDLAIVVGGDGYMLGAARALSRDDIAVIGVNRGNLGFLTDLDPDAFEQPLDAVLAGEFIAESRFLLETRIVRNGKEIGHAVAVNEVVLHADKIAHMIEFDAFINDEFVFNQRSDGLIIATPTGSTAYSLSGGGPIINPNLNAVTMVPMFPHTLNNRPLVVDSSSLIKLVISPRRSGDMQVSCDSHISMTVLPGDHVEIRKSPNKLRLVHPKNYSYYNVLRKKLNWGSQNY